MASRIDRWLRVHRVRPKCCGKHLQGAVGGRIRSLGTIGDFRHSARRAPDSRVSASSDREEKGKRLNAPSPSCSHERIVLIACVLEPLRKEIDEGAQLW